MIIFFGIIRYFVLLYDLQVQRSQKTANQVQLKYQSASSSLDICRKKLEKANLREKELMQELEATKSALLRSTQRVNVLQKELTSVRKLNQQWQEVSVDKYNIIHGTYRIASVGSNRIYFAHQ